MIFKYTITAADFLEYYLYMVSKSAAISKKRNIAKYSFSVIYALFAVYFLYSEMYGLGMLFMLLAFLWYFLYPKLNRKSLERFYAKYTQEHFGHQMNRITEMKLEHPFLSVSDGKINTKIPVAAIEKTIETPGYFFIRETSGNTFIVPKNQIDSHLFAESIAAAHIAMQDETIWQWK